MPGLALRGLLMLICSASDHWATGLDSLTDLHPALGAPPDQATLPLLLRGQILDRNQKSENGPRACLLVHFPKV